MARRGVIVGPRDEVLLVRADAAWLARITAETLRQWVKSEQLFEVENGGRLLVPWTALRECAARHGHAVAHWSWLERDLTEEAPASRGDADDAIAAGVDAVDQDEEVGELRREVAQLRLQLATAMAEAENLDQAVMSYRDNWRRRTQPQSPSELPTRSA